jgi:hypothetical protein
MASDAERGLSRFPYHGTIHDLFAALRDHDGRISKVLAQHRVTISQIRRAARRLTDTDGTSEGGTYSPSANRTIDEWIELFNTDDVELRIEAGLHIMPWASTLAESNDAATLAQYAPRVVPLMVAAMRDRSEDLRFLGARILSHFGERAKEALPVARAVMGTGQVVTVEAVEAAGVVWNVTADAEAVFPTILAALRSATSLHREFAFGVLGTITKTSHAVPAEVLAVLIEKLKSTDIAESLQACKILAKLDSSASAAVPALLELFAELDRLPAQKEENSHFAFSTEHRLAHAIGALFRINPDREVALSIARGFLSREVPELVRGVLVGWTIAGPSASIALPHVDWLVNHPDPAARLLAMVAHRRITGQHKHEAALLKSLPSVTPESQVIVAGLLKENDEPELAAKVLAQFDPPKPKAKTSQQTGSPAKHDAKPPGDPLAYELALWDEAIQFDPTDSQAFVLRADVRHRAKEFDAAIADYRHAMALDPTDTTASTWLVESLNQRENPCKPCALT